MINDVISPEFDENAIVGIRFSTSNIAQGASELFVYGTAVIVHPKAPTLPDPFSA